MVDGRSEHWGRGLDVDDISGPTISEVVWIERYVV